MSTERKRALGASEVYYQLIERQWPTNSQGVVEFAADRATVAAAWAETVRSFPVLGARIVHGERGAEIVFGGPGTPEPWGDFATLGEAMVAQATQPIDITQCVARCTLVAGEGVTTAAFAIHHSVVDGRGLFQIACYLAALISGEEPPKVPLLQDTVALEALVAERVDPGRRRRELLGLAREVRSEASYVDNADEVPWHEVAPGRGRDVDFVLFRVDAEHTTRLRENARAASATVHGMLVAATLHACAQAADPFPAPTRLGLSSAVDLRVACGVSLDEPIGQAAAVMTSSYDVTLPSLDLAREASADIRRRVDRGEAELMFALSGAERMPIGPASDDVVRRWATAVQPTIQVSNLGVVPGPVPASLRTMHAALAPAPNQAIFVAATTVHGEMDVAISYDRNRISVDGAALATDIERRLLALARA